MSHVSRTKIGESDSPLVVTGSSVHVSDELRCLHPRVSPPGEAELRHHHRPPVWGQVLHAGLVEDVGHDAWSHV